MTDRALSIREAIPADAEAISEVDRASHLVAYAPIFGDDLEFFSPEENLDHWHRILSWQAGSRAARWVLVGCLDDRIVGYAGVMPSRDADAPTHVGEVGALYVHPDWWRRGIGSRLLGVALDFLAGKGFTEATLWVLQANLTARAFYEAQGWKDDGARQSPEGASSTANLTEARYRRPIEHGSTQPPA